MKMPVFGAFSHDLQIRNNNNLLISDVFFDVRDSDSTATNERLQSYSTIRHYPLHLRNEEEAQMDMPISEQQLSKQLGLSLNTLYRLRESEKLHYTRIGKRVFYTGKHIQNYLKQGDTMLRRKAKR